MRAQGGVYGTGRLALSALPTARQNADQGPLAVKMKTYFKLIGSVQSGTHFPFSLSFFFMQSYNLLQNVSVYVVRYIAKECVQRDQNFSIYLSF